MICLKHVDNIDPVISKWDGISQYYSCVSTVCLPGFIILLMTCFVLFLRLCVWVNEFQSII